MTNSPSPQAVSLLPCPHCKKAEGLVVLDYKVWCSGCKAYGPAAGSRKDAIAAWNRRASPADGVVVPREAVARVVNRSAWLFFDNAMRPFLEGRGAKNDEAWIYEITYGKLGFRTPEQVRQWLFEGEPRPGVSERDHTVLQETLAKADAILALSTPSADADKLRIAREALKKARNDIQGWAEAAGGNGRPDVLADDLDDIDQALALLSSNTEDQK